MMQPFSTTEAGEPEEPVSPGMVVPVQVTAPMPPGAALRTAKLEPQPSDAVRAMRASPRADSSGRLPVESGDAGGADPQARKRSAPRGTRTNRALRGDIACSLVE